MSSRHLRTFWAAILVSAIVLSLCFPAHTLSAQNDDVLEPTATATPYSPPDVYPTKEAEVEPLPPPTATPQPTPDPYEAERALALKYATSQLGDLDELTLLNEHDRSYPTLGRMFRSFTFTTRSGKMLQLLVDPTSHTVVGDVAAIEQEEAEAYAARYGKLHPILWERLQTVTGDETLPVALWLTHDLAAAQQHIWTLLAQKYPVVQEAQRQQRGFPFLVEDEALADQVRREYEGLLAQEMRSVKAPLLEMLRTEVVDVYDFDLLPSVAVTLTAA